MIRSREEFDGALQEVCQLLADPPAPGSAADARFAQLLRDVAAYRSDQPMIAEQDDATARAVARLDRELADFSRRHPDHPARALTGQFGFGQDLRGH